MWGAGKAKTAPDAMGKAPLPSEAGGTARRKRGADAGRVGECPPHRGFMVASPEPKRNAKAAPDAMREAANE
jgi:hypothetical protein